MQHSRRRILASALIFMGLAHLVYRREYMKGAFFALIELVFLSLIPLMIRKLSDLITLGEPQPDLAVRLRDNSVFMLIDGIAAAVLICLFIAVYTVSVKSALALPVSKKRKSIRAQLEDALGSSFPVLALTPSFILIAFFVIVPLMFSICVAFTNYSSPGHIPPANTVDWVGLANFKALLGSGTGWSQGFSRIAVWTLTWAACATLTCYFAGLFIAVLLKGSNIQLAPIFRIVFILPYAIPSVVSMLVWKNLLNGSFGTVNRSLMALGLISSPIPWLSSPLLAQITVIVINLWAGFGYFMMLAMGTMSAIPDDLYEAARIDGAGPLQSLKRITLPLIFYQTSPLIIMSFIHNINNFGVIYFLTGGAPTAHDTTTTLAGSTDILVTWIYKLTVNLLRYNYASVIAVLIFIVLAPFAIWNFRRTRAFKEGNL